VRLDWQLVTGNVDRVNVRNQVQLVGSADHDPEFFHTELEIVVLKPLLW
jgi:hypothetical protein